MKTGYNALRGRRGFTLTEMMLAIGILGFVMASVVGVYIAAQKLWYSNSLELRLSNKTGIALQRIVYGVLYDLYYPGLRAANWDTVEVTSSATNWSVKYDTPDTTGNIFSYSAGSGCILFTPGGLPQDPMVIATNVIASTVTTNEYSDGLGIMIRMAMTEGRFGCTNEMSTQISFRN